MHRTAWILLAVALSSLPLRADLRAQRVLDWRSGLPSSFTFQIEQDPQGFLWFTTTGGVVRYDGSQVRVVAPAPAALVQGSVAAGRPLFRRATAEGSAVQDERGKPLPGPRGTPLVALHACVTPDGAVWARTREGLWREDGKTWAGPYRLPGGREIGDGPWSWAPDGVVVTTRDEAWAVSRSGASRRLATARGLVAVVRGPDGTTLLGCWRRDGGHVLEVGPRGTREIETSPSRLMALAVRDGAIWVAYDSKLVRIPPQGPSEEIGVAQGLISGGDLWVDREGSLWVATFRGAQQFPEPETTSLLDRFPGLPRNIVRTPEAVWASSWSGAIVGRRSAAGWSFEKALSHINPVCAAADGSVWTVGSPGFIRHAAGRATQMRAAPGKAPTYAHRCALGPTGRLWFPTDLGLFVLSGTEGPPRAVASPPFAEGPLAEAVVEGAAGDVWAAQGSTMCHAPSTLLVEARPGAWTCERVPGMLGPVGLRVMPSGDLWVATHLSGVWRRHAGRWEPLGASRTLVTPTALALVPSPAGGTWIVGEANCLRVAERPDTPEGWEVLERLGVWQGLPTSGLMDLAEDPDGTLWLATDMSLVRVPPAARAARPLPPSVALVEAAVDGRPIGTGGIIELPFGKNRLELRFAALSYREPALIRYRARRRPGEPWSEPTPQPGFRFVDLPPGRYGVEVEAILDGIRWSPARVAVAARVLPPWWASWWFLASAALLVAALLVLAYRLRVARLLGLERQRTQIAMDLHDAIGSGLGSIRILSGLALRETTPDAARAEVAGRIARIADELAGALGDIVWSLRPGVGTLEALGTQLVARATPLVSAAGMALETRMPEPWPEVCLALGVRRHVLLVALEALHNAVRHSAGRHVVLALEYHGRRWRLRVEDDGRGLAPVAPTPGGRSGLGLESIRRRAREIGAEARWTPRPGGGTIFTLEFDPRAERGFGREREATSHDRATGAAARSPVSREQR